MRFLSPFQRVLALALACAGGISSFAQNPDEVPLGGGPDFDGPPPFGPGGFAPGGPGGAQPEIQLVKKFDKNGDGWLNAEERKAARDFLAKEGGSRRPGGPGRRRGGFGGRQDNQTTVQPGPKVTPAEVGSFPEAPLYASNVVRTIFLEFEDAAWEKELAEFKNTDVEVPAKVTVDGKTYPDVGVHFHGKSSFMMVGEGQKRSLVLSLNFINPDQQIDGYHKLNLLNSHEDPSFLRTVLSLQVARDYLPAPQANFVRVVINGESWGIYVNQQHFDKEFTREWFGSSKGARWKVPGSPNGRGGLDYLGEEAAPYERIYEIKSKDTPQSWTDLIKLCKVLNETPSDQLEKALAPMLDIDGVLKFLAWENALASGDGFYTRASDYDLYEDAQGRFHIIPYDANETFSFGGGPGGPGGPGAPGGFGPGMILAEQLLEQGDKNQDGKLTREEFSAAGDAWFAKLDAEKTGRISQEQFTAQLGDILPPPPGFGRADGRGTAAGGQSAGAARGFGPARFLGPALFLATDANKDGSLTGDEFRAAFSKWFADWNVSKSGALNESELRDGFNGILPHPNFGRPGGGPPRGGPGGGGVELDPLVSAKDASKPLISKLFAVPSLRMRYLGYVRDIAERWLDWNKLGPLALQYQSLISQFVKEDRRKLDSTEGFLKGVSGEVDSRTSTQRGSSGSSLKEFAERRRVFLLNHAAIKDVKASTP